MRSTARRRDPMPFSSPALRKFHARLPYSVLRMRGAPVYACFRFTSGMPRLRSFQIFLKHFRFRAQRDSHRHYHSGWRRAPAAIDTISASLPRYQHHSGMKGPFIAMAPLTHSIWARHRVRFRATFFVLWLLMTDTAARFIGKSHRVVAQSPPRGHAQAFGACLHFIAEDVYVISSWSYHFSPY